MTETQNGARKNGGGRLWLLLALLVGTLLVLFRQSFLPNYVLFANDAPLGAIKALENRMPEAFSGTWHVLNWIGSEGVSAAPNISNFLATIFSPPMFLKIYGPFSLFFVGFSAWLFFRELGFNAMVCVLGGLAAGLNMHFFSVASWGLAQWNLAFGAIFLAFAAISTKSIKPVWARAILSGLAIGLALMEGFDCGAILSVYVGVFVLFQAFNQEGSLGPKIANGIVAGTLVVLFSALLASHTIFTLVETQIKGVAVSAESKDDADKNLTAQEKANKARAEKDNRFRECTQWSVPKLETLRVIIPGMFGYRMTEHITVPDKSSGFWGRIGQETHIPELESSDPAERVRTAKMFGATPEMVEGIQSNDMETRYKVINTIKGSTGMYPRHSGSGEYAGVLVVVLAFFGLANSFRKTASPYSITEKRAVWFWGLAALFSLMAAWGRYGFVYQYLFELPYVSTMRNPMKFMHPFHICLIILAGYGLEVLFRRYLQGTANRTEILPAHLKRWWSKTSGFDKKWAVAMVATVAVAGVAYLLFAASKDQLIWHLNHHGFSAADSYGPIAEQIAAFAIREVAVFWVFLALSALVVVCVVSGAWSAQRAMTVTVLMAAILIVDLGRSDVPWIRYFDYKEKYSLPPNPPNPVVQFLKENPHEQRVAARVSPGGNAYIDRTDGNFIGLCHYWLENDFQYFNIQSFDLDQAPRLPVMDQNFISAFSPNKDVTAIARLWKITNTRYILASAGYAAAFNQQLDPVGQGFRIRALFGMDTKPGVTQFEDAGDYAAELNKDKGPYALIEFTNALPRAKLYSHWQVLDDTTALATVSSAKFDSALSVVVAKDTPLAQAPGDMQANPGTVAITQYQPKNIQLQANAQTPAVLMLNERIADAWKVSVDGKPATLLRCDYIMRGVFLTQGQHKVEFRFQPPLGTLYLSLCGWAIGILVAGYLIFTRRSAIKAEAGAQ